ncbi:TapY2 family type IVa secretion system protein [Thalassotalea agarivorans]|uniref:Uncharacterized protein n=1 Tax=Thalassotalea agarivorans TaxID=349064 RepID=A0A1H9YSY5_THASX|nr:TapY2 family type IVa secretion system protein [Thalassotalea agarivorans]SES72228.1 hypothetical protein SAMN05660429_00337 [Thalassotalea agarivorans]
MKRLVLATALASLPFNLAFAAKKDTVKKIDIKCHVEFTDKTQAIVFTVDKESKINTKTKGILGQKFYNIKRKKESRVVKAFECVALQDEFKTLAAKRLDEVTPK